MSKTVIGCLALVGALLIGRAPWARAGDAGQRPEGHAASVSVERCGADALALVTAGTVAARRNGYGVVVGDGTLVVTAYHLVFEASALGGHTSADVADVISPYLGEIVEARVVAADREWDVAVLKVPWLGHPSVRLADTEEFHTARQARLMTFAGFGPMSDGSAWDALQEERLPVDSVVSRQGVAVRIVLQGTGRLGPGWSGCPILSPDEGTLLGCFATLSRPRLRLRVPGDAGGPAQSPLVKSTAFGPASGLVGELVAKTGEKEHLSRKPTEVSRPPDAGEATAHLLEALRFRSLHGQQPAGAIAELQSFLALRPRSAVGTQLLAVWLWQSGRPGEAESTFRQALELEPDCPGTRTAFGQLLLTQGRADEALAEFRAARALRPEDPVLDRLIAQTLSTLGQADAALEEIEAAVRRHPDNAHLRAALAGFHEKQGHRQEAIETLREAVRLFPDNGGYRLELAALLEQAGLLEEAEAHLRDLLVLDPDHAGWTFHLADFLARRGGKARGEALVLAERARELGGESGAHGPALMALLSRLRGPTSGELVGAPAPEPKLEDGADACLSQFKGKPVVLAFVSIYSRPCVKVLDELNGLQEKQGAEKLGVIAVHDRTATREEIEQFRKEHSIPFPIARVPDAPRDGWDSATFRAYGVIALPTVVRIDAGGKVESAGANLP